MSHSHTHAPGETHSHSHGPPQPQQPQQMPQQQPQQAPPQMIAPQPDPIMQAIIDQSFHPVDLKLGEPSGQTVLCGPHSLEKCTECEMDFVGLNRLSKVLFANPSLLCPPPAKVVNQKLSQAIHVMKEEGNNLFKAGQYDKAISRYTMGANIACQRPPWEAQQIMREELSAIVSNRSAAYLESGDAISSLVDAETVIQMRRNWNKGHVRKAKALLALGKPQEAKDAIALGVAFEPNSAEWTPFLEEINAAVSQQDGKTKDEPLASSSPIPV